ncbi:MAG: methylase [Planctomycetaceae bacterium]|nr:methylase [Planctomycetaceae bacterium]
MSDHRPEWSLPPGVTRGLWDYAHSDPIAEDYDEYFAHNRLFEFDEQVILRELEERDLSSDCLIADLGCGTGRAIVPLARRGYRGLAVDLSEKMLAIVKAKAEAESLPIECVHANLVELDCVEYASIDAAISLFSTLGMIRGRTNRFRALEHTARILKPGSPFVLHAHNYWFNLYDPGGPWWVLRNFCRASFVRDIEAGDKFFSYRGLPNMFLHVFRLGELKRDLRRAGFQVTRIIPLDPRRHRALRMPCVAGRLRANGWIVVAERRS